MQAPLGDRAVRVIAGFNVAVIAGVLGLSVARAVDLIPGAEPASVVVGAVFAVVAWAVLTRWVPVAEGRCWARGARLALGRCRRPVRLRPLGLLVMSSAAVATLGRRLARNRAPGSAAGFLRSPIVWSLLALYALVGIAYYATPPVTFERAAVTSSAGEQVGGYIGRSNAGVYIATCTPLARRQPR